MISALLAYSSILLVFSSVFVLALRHSLKLAIVCALVASGLLFVPVNDVYLLLQLKGVFADLSLTTVLLLIAWPLSRAIHKSHSQSDITWLCATVVTLALALYPMALGAGPYDVYASGYQPFVLLSIVGGMGVLAIQKGYWVCTAAVVVGMAGYWLKVLPSQNFWDYLLDPILTIIAAGFLLRQLYRRISLRSEETPHST